MLLAGRGVFHPGAHPGETARAKSHLAASLGSDAKGKLSLVLYAASIPLAFLHGALSIAIFVIVALIWLLPDRRIEKTLASG